MVKDTKDQIYTYIRIGLVAIAHIVFVILAIMLWSYKNIAQDLFFIVLGAILCLLVILDVILIFSLRHNYKALRITSIVYASIMIIMGVVGLVAVGTINKTVDNIVDTPVESQKEMIRVSFVSYENNQINSIEDLDGKKVGSLIVGSGISSASVGREYLQSNNINPNYSTYDTTTSLFEALIAKEIDAAIFSNVFKTQLSNDGFDDLLEKTNVFATYEEEVQTSDEGASNKDITVEPFTVLLIGYAPEEGGGGLTDTIILASVNPQTMQVLLTSIPRDSYVPIACYGGTRSKINDAGAASNACLMDTVEDLMGIDIDFYMKVNFQGVVDIVDAVGGIDINSPVEFVGQNATSQRGHYTVWIPQGYYHANGEAALAFARERHAMPNGDFDRQIHQQEVITEIAKKILNMGSINEALKVLKAAGDNFTTNLSVEQLTSVFNYILNAPNYSNISQFSLIDIMQSRLTGYASWFYSYSMRLPLWSYRLYEGSIKENANLARSVLNEFDNIDQEKGFKFFEKYPYVKDQVYSEYFDEPIVIDEMPAYYPSLTSMTYQEAMAWASQNGVQLSVTIIDASSPSYVASSAGSIVDQSPRYGALVEEYPTGSITVMGDPGEIVEFVPNFVGGSLNNARQWANDHGISLEAKEIEGTNSSDAGVIASQSVAEGTSLNNVTSITVEYYGYPSVNVGSLHIGSTTENEVKAWVSQNLVVTPSYEYRSDSRYSNGTLLNYSYDTSTPKMNSYFVFVIVDNSSVPHEHNWKEVSRTEATYTSTGEIVYACECGEKAKETIPMLTCPGGKHYDSSSGSCVLDHEDPPVTPTCPEGHVLDPDSNTCVIVEQS